MKKAQVLWRCMMTWNKYVGKTHTKSLHWGLKRKPLNTTKHAIRKQKLAQNNQNSHNSSKNSPTTIKNSSGQPRTTKYYLQQPKKKISPRQPIKHPKTTKISPRQPKEAQDNQKQPKTSKNSPRQLKKKWTQPGTAQCTK